MINMPIGDFPLPQQGWQCPICKSVMAPSTPMCFNCKPKNQFQSTMKCDHGIPVSLPCVKCNHSGIYMREYQT